jgi:hypothetical protein
LVVAISVIVFLMGALLDDVLQAARAAEATWGDLVHNERLCPVDEVLLGVPDFPPVGGDALEHNSFRRVPGK